MYKFIKLEGVQIYQRPEKKNSHPLSWSSSTHISALRRKSAALHNKFHCNINITHFLYLLYIYKPHDYFVLLEQG